MYTFIIIAYILLSVFSWITVYRWSKLHPVMTNEIRKRIVILIGLLVLTGILLTITIILHHCAHPHYSSSPASDISISSDWVWFL